AVSTVPGTVGEIWGLWSRVQLHIQKRGLFNGHELEKMIDRLIRKGFGTEELPPHIQAIMPPEGDEVCFDHVERMMRAKGGQFYRPPLLLTATNLSRRKLEVISSIDPSYRRTPIAAAVRASAGFPIFFRPRQFGEGLNKEWFVDGGVISSFPLWTF